MKIRDIATELDATVYAGKDMLDMEVTAACGADLMSDVMAFVKDRVVLLTGLVTPQSIRTADLLDIRAIVFVRGKTPTADMVEMALDNNMILLATRYSMFLACGRLYAAGLVAGGTRTIE